MIGLIVKNKELEIVHEFFQLFKVPWELYESGKHYDTVITTQNVQNDIDAALIIVFDSKLKISESAESKHNKKDSSFTIIKCDELKVPIYGEITDIDIKGKPIIVNEDGKKNFAVGTDNYTKTIYVGYNLFSEISFLLTIGQPAIMAHIPSVEIHISILRKLILTSGIYLIEVPPVPAGYNFITFLSHDVDFIGIRRHLFDHSMFGFIYRASFVSFRDCLSQKTSWTYFLKNLVAILKLPFVYLGISKDIWSQFDNYISIEKHRPSTYFFIPFKNRSGSAKNIESNSKRAAKYDVTDIKSEIDKLIINGDEIGLHGIDAWHNLFLAKKEMKQILQGRNEEIGVRMHWLYFSPLSYKILDDAGFIYDSTMGYNDTIGFKCGTTQAFKPFGVKNLIEIPLHIQDNPLFLKNKKRRNQNEIWELCRLIVNNFKSFGGILTLLWHQRSTAPERLYGDFYCEFLEYLEKTHKVWFASGSQVVKWVKKRRQFCFKDIEFCDNTLKIRNISSADDSTPPLILRIYHSKFQNNDSTASSKDEKMKYNFFDIYLTDFKDKIIDFNSIDFHKVYPCNI